MRAEEIKIDSDSEGFEMTVLSDEGSFTFNVHGCAVQLLEEVQRTIGEWWAEGQRYRGGPGPVTEDDLEGYDLGDPKRISLQREIDKRR
jgi:hypothetical protein